LLFITGITCFAKDNLFASKVWYTGTVIKFHIFKIVSDIFYLQAYRLRFVNVSIILF